MPDRGDFRQEDSDDSTPRTVLLHSSFKSWGGAETLVARHYAAFAARGVDVAAAALRPSIAAFGAGALGSPRLQKRRSFVETIVSAHPGWALRLRARRARALVADADVVVAYNSPAHVAAGLHPSSARRFWQCNEPDRRMHLAAANPVAFARAKRFADEGRAPPDLATQNALRRLKKLDLPWKRAAVASFLEVEREAVSALDGVFALSEFGRDNARRAVGRCDDVPIPPITPAPSSRRTTRRAEGEDVLAVGRVEPEKNVDGLLLGFAALLRRRPAARLHVVGAGGRSETVQKIAAASCPGPSVVFHGAIDDDALADLRRRCGVFASFPIDEPFGMVFAEAALAGQIVVGPNHGGPLEILDGGRLGLLADPFDPEAIADALDRALGLDDAAKAATREAAADSCAARYAEDVVVPALMTRLGIGGRPRAAPPASVALAGVDA
jgi:glycosyltransferase involved in cell wall biosynthesis